MRLTFCALCGSTENLEHHHFLPRSRGGSDDGSNILTLCSRCHGLAHEVKRGDISVLTREGLTWARAMGVKLGSPNLAAARTVAVAKKRLDTRRRDAGLLAVAGAGTLEERAARLNAAGYRTLLGKPFTKATVSRMLKRAEAC